MQTLSLHSNKITAIEGIETLKRITGSVVVVSLARVYSFRIQSILYIVNLSLPTCTLFLLLALTTPVGWRRPLRHPVLTPRVGSLRIGSGQQQHLVCREQPAVPPQAALPQPGRQQHLQLLRDIAAQGLEEPAGPFLLCTCLNWDHLVGFMSREFRASLNN